MSAPDFDVMTPITRENGVKVWVKVGVAWRNEGKYKINASVTSLPLAAFGGSTELQLYFYPARKDAKEDA